MQVDEEATEEDEPKVVEEAPAPKGKRGKRNAAKGDAKKEEKV